MDTHLLPMQDHRRLDVWQKARELALEVRRATRTFPRAGYSSLQRQMTDAVESVVFTIAEGCGAATQREFARFLDMSVKSANELEAQLELARDYGVLKESSWKIMAAQTISVRRMAYALRLKVLSPDPKPPRQPATANPPPLPATANPPPITRHR
jgi:four helix bundle protein